MAYVKHNYQSGDVLKASDLNDMDDQIEALTESMEDAGLVTPDQTGIIITVQGATS